jgi:hypothetical protein
MEITVRGFFSGTKIQNDCTNGSVAKILKRHKAGVPLSRCIVDQASKYPKSLRQWEADLFLLLSLLRIKYNGGK